MTGNEPSWALVTGASSGLGAAFATRLAARGANLVLAARREAPMQTLAAELRQRHNIEVVVETIDLGEANAAASLQQRLESRHIHPDILINNAAFGLSSAFVDHDPARLAAMLQLDVVALTQLTYVFGRCMAKRGRGHILLVASMAAYQPVPLLAAYGAAKAFVLSFGVALHVELAPKVGVTVLSPGLMETEFFDVSGYQPPASMKRTILTPAKVAQIGLNAMFAHKSSVIAGKLNRLMVLGSNLFTRHQQAKMAYKMSKT